ncbi:hypothetical protein CC86DRAFT_413248 [Ophiobolus disseminans]|uniref:Uncharacterized protein n=1 Tax=Ophiobolus disseminans TaxID=1469910 RepID=A0A6A6ZEP9_9PLEO|nr:hypothetical protein CC86DRAFT_413248 [Ophiobolus disseminans]
MYDAAEKADIEWHVILLASFADGGGEMKLWTYEVRCRGFDSELLLGYASQYSLQDYAENWDVERTEPTHMEDDDDMEEESYDEESGDEERSEPPWDPEDGSEQEQEIEYL